MQIILIISKLMKNRIFPIEITEFSVEALLRKYSKRSYVIYIVVLLFVLFAFAALFFITVDVSVRASGILKTPGERIAVTAPASGRIYQLRITENDVVSKGDTLFVVSQDVWKEQAKNYQVRKDELVNLLSDLNQLTASNKRKQIAFKTDYYQQSFALYSGRQASAQSRLEVVEKNYTRHKLLLKDKVIAQATFEPVEGEYNEAKSAISTLYNEQMNQWQSDQQQYQLELQNLESQINQLDIQQQQLIVLAPVSGSIQQLAGVRQGNYVTEGQQLVEISPDSTLQVECYVSPKDIGLIRTGQVVRIQADAYNYNEWGMLDGCVTGISHDITIQNSQQQPFFKVFCRLEKTHLTLKNGFTGQLKKGMTANIRFVVTRRTLFQMLYDKTDDWLNPNSPKEISN